MLAILSCSRDAMRDVNGCEKSGEGLPEVRQPIGGSPRTISSAPSERYVSNSNKHFGG
jgi:hypothetical protein